MIVGLFGIMKAGGAYLPLDPSYPKERLGFMLEDAQARLLLTHSALLDQLPLDFAEAICLDLDWPQIARREAYNPKNSAKPANLAYVIYTSGSTGKPKGVCVAPAVFHNNCSPRLLCIPRK